MTSLKDMESKLKVAQQTNASEGEELGQWKAEKEHLSYVITYMQEEMLQLKENNAALVLHFYHLFTFYLAYFPRDICTGVELYLLCSLPIIGCQSIEINCDRDKQLNVLLEN